MKKLFILPVLALILVGCGAKKVDYKPIMKKMADAYFEKYVKGHTLEIDIQEVSIASLKNANKNSDGNFDVSKLKDCRDSSYIKLSLNRETQAITKYEYKMNCEQK